MVERAGGDKPIVFLPDRDRESCSHDFFSADILCFLEICCQ
jgi:hypothetical protein